MRLAGAALGLALAACRAPEAPPPLPPAPAAEPAAPARAPVVRGLAGTSAKGRAIRYVAVGDGARTVLVLASIHGDEAAGTPLVRALVGHLEARPERVAGLTVVVVPEVNPDGVAAGTRGNANGVDLNRDFPARNARAGGAPREPESRAVLDLVDARAPERILTLHQPVGVLDWDGPAEAVARAMAAAGPLPARRLGARPGSLGSWAGVDRGIAVVTVELPRSADRLDEAELWEAYGRMMLAGLPQPGPRPRGRGP